MEEREKHEAELDLRPFGQFWLAASPKERYAGYLDMTGESPRVRVLGGFAKHTEYVLQDCVILGDLQLSRHRKVTLFNCFLDTISNADGGRDTYAVSTCAVFGAHFNSWNEVCIIAVGFRLPTLASWFHADCFSFAHDHARNVASVEYSIRDGKTYTIDDATSLSLEYTGNIHVGGWGREEVLLERPLGLVLRKTEAFHYDDLHELAHWFRCFFSLLLDRTLDMQSIWVEVPGGDAPGDIVVLQVRHSHERLPAPMKRFSFDDPLVRHDQINGEIDHMLQRWPLLVNDHRDSLARFFSGMFNPTTGIIEEFLTVIAACEELDRVAYGEAELFAQLRRLCKSIPGLVAEHASDEVLKQIKDSRHYYAHALGKKSGNAARDFLLIRYTLFLKRLYAAHLFRLMGIPAERIVEIVMQRYEWREALSLKAFPNAR